MKERKKIQKCRYLRNLLHYDTAENNIAMMSNLNSTYLLPTILYDVLHNNNS